MLSQIKRMLGARPTTCNLRPKTILVVEDNPDNMTAMKAVLKNKCHMLEATDGEEGLKLALSERPDLILLDISLPKMDGFEVVKELRQDKEAGHIPVIALTARAMESDREKVIKAGCDDCIVKPVDLEEVLRKTRKWLEEETHAENISH